MTTVAPTKSLSPTPPTMVSDGLGPNGGGCGGTAGPGPATSRDVHASPSRFTFDWLISVSAL